MNRKIFAVTSILLFGLTACDKVRVPGVNPTGQTPAKEARETPSETPPDPTKATTETDPAIAPVSPTPAEEQLELTAQDGEGSSNIDADTSDAETPEDAGSPADPENDDETETAETGTDGESVIPVVTSLAALNATRCSLAAGAIPTPTIGMVAGATDVEVPEVGTAAVNALASQLADFPGIVKLEPRDVSDSGVVSRGHCGATRISERWFVSAAHCVDEPYQNIDLIIGASNIRSPVARTVQADIAICHGGYDGVNNSYANDVAMIRVNAAALDTMEDIPIAQFGRTEKPLAPANYPDVDMAGWGLTSYGGQLSNELLGATLRLKAAGPAMISVSSQAGAGPCVGDSGGPLFVTEADGARKVIGVLSVVEQDRKTGEFCAGDYNGRYTNLKGYADWMTSVMTLCELNEEMCE
jgi:hypothetical protein